MRPLRGPPGVAVVLSAPWQATRPLAAIRRCAAADQPLAAPPLAGDPGGPATPRNLWLPLRGGDAAVVFLERCSDCRAAAAWMRQRERARSSLSRQCHAGSERLRIVRSEARRGQGAARNTALGWARSQSCLGQDDFGPGNTHTQNTGNPTHGTIGVVQLTLFSRVGVAKSCMTLWNREGVGRRAGTRSSCGV